MHSKYIPQMDKKNNTLELILTNNVTKIKLFIVDFIFLLYNLFAHILKCMRIVIKYAMSKRKVNYGKY